MRAITKDAIMSMMEEELALYQETEPRKTVTRSEILTMMQEEFNEGLTAESADLMFSTMMDSLNTAHSKLQTIASVLEQAGSTTEELRSQIKSLESTMIALDDTTKPDLEAIVSDTSSYQSGGPASAEDMESVESDYRNESRQRPLKRDREKFSRNTKIVMGLQNTITKYLKETGARLDGRHRDVIERMSTRLMHVANSPMINLAEGDATSRMITKLEDIGGLISFGVKELDYESQPEVGERLERAEQMIQELWEEMHNLL